MKKIIFIAFAAILAGFAISCQKEELVSEKTDAVQYTFNITVNELTGFDNDASTKGGAPEYKTEWKDGDKIFLFFKPNGGSLLGNTYVTLTYDKGTWNSAQTTTGSPDLGTGGTLSAVYVYKLDNSVTPDFSDGQWTIPTGNVFYNCQTGVEYSVSGSEISATLNLMAPLDFVRFRMMFSTDGPLTCNKVKGWKDVVIGSDMTIDNATCTGYMSGVAVSSGFREFYGRIVDGGGSLKNETCYFSIVQGDEVKDHIAIPTSDARSFEMSISSWKVVPKNSLTCRFTVGKGADNKAGTSDDVIVRFSKGNLVATINASGTPTAWKFATNQYDYLGEGGANKTIGTTAGDVDLFGWSTDATSNNWGIHTKTSSDDDYTSGNFNDWGVAYCSKNSITAGTWRTLSTAEWQYLFNTRTVNGGTGEGYSYQKATINSDATGVYGVILYPDNYISQTSATSYTSSDWTLMETAGCVFLPAAGARSGSDFFFVGSYGYYWSSSLSDNVNTQAYDVYFDSGEVSPDSEIDLNCGLSVRLVTDIK